VNRILIVDDHPDIRRLLGVTLGKNHEVLEAENGEKALQAIAQHRPKVVLLDIMMPGELDGLQVLQAIRADPNSRATRVAVVSARGQDADRDHAMSMGADAYFVKPFSPLEVVDWVKQQFS
jgi:DNA-binding response OmpR family regulator